MLWDTACLDWEARIMAGRSLVPSLPIDEKEAARAVRVFNRLRLPDVPGQPRLAEATGDWFRDIVRALFGAFDSETNRRAIQEVFLLVPKKNAKSTSAAALMVTALIVNRRPNAEALLIAPTKEIADIAFRQAEGMIKADEDLSALFHPQRHIRTITHHKSGAYLKIKAADTDAITGVLSTYILVDETHVFAAKPRAADVFTEVRGAMAARPDGFMVQITTQSKTPPSGVFLAELRQARAVRDGRRKAPLLPVLYELPTAKSKEQAWKDPALFGVVNPNLGRSVDEAFLVREMDKAAEAGADAMALFASQHLNVEIGLGLQSDAWAGAEQWAAAADTTLTLDALLSRSEAVVVGVDGGGLDDLLGLAVLGRERVTRRWLLWSHAWAHPIALKRRKEISARLHDFAADGDLTIVGAIGQDVADVADIVARVRDSGLMPERAAVGLDPAGIGALVDALADRGITGEALVGVNQGWRLNGAIKTTERKLAANEMAHAGQPLMAWCVGNAKVEPRGNAVLITKQAAGSAKIDPLMAAFNAVELMARNPLPQALDGVF
jgi:phage terminase large subunit-like protein